MTTATTSSQSEGQALLNKLTAEVQELERDLEKLDQEKERIIKSLQKIFSD